MAAYIPLASAEGAAARTLMPLPPPEPAAALLARVQSCDTGLPELQPCCLPCEKLWAHRGKLPLKKAVRQLRHRLSPFMQMPALDLEAVRMQEEREARIYQRWRQTLSGPLSVLDVQRFIMLCTGSEGSLRTHPVCLRSQDGHTLLQMVDARDAAERWGELLSRFTAAGPAQGVRAAVQMLALVNNAHAFADGNGRLGRALFNLWLHRAGMPDACFIPLKILAVLSRGGYELRLREAELYGRWDELYAYHCCAIELYAWLGQQSAGPGQNEDV